MEDIVVAPLLAFLLRAAFQSDVVAAAEFVTQALPFGTDAIPVASLTWLLKYIFTDSPLTKLLGLDSPPVEVEDEGTNWKGRSDIRNKGGGRDSQS